MIRRRRAPIGLGVRVARLVTTTVALTALGLPATEAPSGASVAGSATVPACTAPAVTSMTGSSFSANETLCRIFFDQGAVDVRDFAVSVSDTTELRDGQVVTVSWTGAHPTGGVISAEQAAAAADQEYPVVLMECRGIDSQAVPASEQLSPKTCWTATPEERVIPGSSVPLWSLDAYNTDQQLNVNVPSPLPAACEFDVTGYQYWVPFVAADGSVYNIGDDGCAGTPPEMQDVTASTQLDDAVVVPSDTTYAETAPNGKGSANFTIDTADTNASLGCSDTVACSLVIVPIEGISCNANPDEGSPQNACEATGNCPTGLNVGGCPNPDASVTGSYWWSGSNWQRRISVPLSFAPSSNVCNQASSSAPLELYGSELMAQATQQWNPHFCLNSKLFSVNHVQIPEPQAKNLLQQGSIEAAIQGEPPPVPAGKTAFFGSPTVQAPIGMTGFAIAYDIDNADGQPYEKLRLDPRLLAKLMTESYSGTNNIKSGDVGIANNPESIFDDPEFQALNPTYTLTPSVQDNSDSPESAATLFSILSQSDVIWALTSYINADPEARAWLNGAPDPWGMTVNPAYKRIQLPVESWPLLDTSTRGPDYTQQNPCLEPQVVPGQPKQTLVPDRPLVDNPEDTLEEVAYDLQYSISASEICPPGADELAEMGPEILGTRFLIGVVSLPAAEEYDLHTAALQSYANPESQPAAAFPGDRVFVTPEPASLQAAAALLQPDPAVGSWEFPYNDFPSDQRAQGAYPGIMLMSADVPSAGLPQPDATQYGQYLTFAAKSGQVPGPATGQLPAGYLPMTAANGLAAEVAYTEAAAADVAAQNGEVPQLISGPPKTRHPTTTTTTTTPPKSHPTTTQQTSSTTSTTAVTSSSSTATSSSGSSSASSTTTEPGRPLAVETSKSRPSHQAAGLPKADIQPAAAVGRTVGFESGFGGFALPLALLLALLGSSGSAAIWWRRRRRAPS